LATKIFGLSDDLIEFRGDVKGEVGCYSTDDDKHGTLVICSDGTILEVKYGKGNLAIWWISLLNKGQLFDELIQCTNEDDDIYSDIATFKDGLKFAYAATEWQRVK